LRRSKVEITAKGHDPAAAEGIVSGLEDAGAQIGALQVGCCTPARMPLYATMLEELMAVRRTVKKAAGIGH